MNEELKKLLAWFDNYEITFNEIRLSQCQYIFDLRKFISVQTNSVVSSVSVARSLADEHTR